MSKAAEWSNILSERPTFSRESNFGRLIAKVSNDGDLQIKIRNFYFDEISISPEDAVQFAKWLIDTFGD